MITRTLKFLVFAKYLILLSCCYSAFGQSTFTNPILRGSHPDPSICRVGDMYYMVNSTFEYYPGLPIHKSKDLVNWELIGYGLHRESQVTGSVNLKDVQSDGGIHAPTIRYHKGVFYIITTNVYYHEKSQTTDFVNFVITADNPSGPWSQPHVLEGAPGIDPDIFFDDDGRVWYVGTHSPAQPNFQGEGEIWLQEIDLSNWKLTGERFFLWRGACGGVWAEGPHMYKYDDRYYLMIAEGGTSFNHAVMIAVSDTITGPYISNERNPILSSRHLSYDNWVHSTGHADMFETHDGQWYMVALGIRGDENRNSNMGRETFLVPMSWEEEPFDWKSVKYKWPVVSPNHGRILRNELLPFKNSVQSLTSAFHDGFNSDSLDFEWSFRRVPKEKFYNLNAKDGFLRLYSSSIPIANRKQTNLMGFRQKESDFEYTVKLNFKPSKNGTSAGMCLFQKDNNYIKYGLVNDAEMKVTPVINIVTKDGDYNLPLNNKFSEDYNGQIELKVISKDSRYRFLYRLPKINNAFTEIGTVGADILLSKGYTGAFLGIFCQSLQDNNDFADFDWVDAQWSIRN